MEHTPSEAPGGKKRETLDGVSHVIVHIVCSHVGSGPDVGDACENSCNLQSSRGRDFTAGLMVFDVSFYNRAK